MLIKRFLQPELPKIAVEVYLIEQIFSPEGNMLFVNRNTLIYHFVRTSFSLDDVQKENRKDIVQKEVQPGSKLCVNYISSCFFSSV